MQQRPFGSLIQISPKRLPVLRKQLSILLDASQKADWVGKAAANDLLPLVQQALVLGMQFDAVVANPPYIGSKGMPVLLKDLARNIYPAGKADIFAMFMERCLIFSRPSSTIGYVTPYVWMFISSYEDIRKILLEKATIQNLIQLEYNAFEPACVPVCALTLFKRNITNFNGSYIKLSDFRGHENQAPKTLEAIRNKNCGWLHNSRPQDFKKIPGYPIVYWSSNVIGELFEKNKNIGEISDFTGSQNITGDNNKYLKMFWEIDYSRFNKDWVPYSKGGSYRKWYGNLEYVVNWTEEARNFYKTNPTSNLLNNKFWFREGICYSDLTSGDYSARFLPKGCIYDKKGPAFHPNEYDLYWIQSALNTPIGTYIFKMLNPTLTLQVREVKMFPLLKPSNELLKKIKDNYLQLMKSSIEDWNSFETSWDFKNNPIIQANKENLCKSYSEFFALSNIRIESTKNAEEENNEIFINAYNLKSELSKIVPDEKITLRSPDREKDSQRLISYVIGCMMGRYSLDEPGLIYAHEGNVGFDASRYKTFPADADGILPVTDEHWFADDAPERVREFLQAVWGPDTLDENMAWLAESLGTKGGETPAETIRRYIADKFYKDHLQTYKKRPIYWLFSSGKQGAFQALVYLHRYHEGTLARMRAEYVVPLTGKMQARIDMLQKDALAASSTAARNKINKEIEKLTKKHAELLAYDEKLRHYADMRIKLDLDDGVKVNYGKFGDLLDSVKVITGGSSDE